MLSQLSSRLFPEFKNKQENKLKETEGPVSMVFTNVDHGLIRLSSESDGWAGKAVNGEIAPSLLIARTNSSGKTLVDPTWNYGNVDYFTLRMTKSAVSSVKRNVLNFIYRIYSKQGDERKVEIPTYKKDDRLAARYTTHFVLFGVSPEWIESRETEFDPRKPQTELDKIDFLFHAQIQVSSDPDILLNTERHTSERIPRKKGEIWGDLGRVFNPPDIELSQGAKAAQARLPREQRFRVGVQRALSWFLHSANGDHLVFQTNQKVYELFQELMGPENLANSTPIHVNGHEATEWKIIMDRQQMGKAEKHMIRTWLLNQVNTALDSIHHSSSPNAPSLATLTIHPFTYELPAYAEILSPKNRQEHDSVTTYYLIHQFFNWPKERTFDGLEHFRRGESLEELRHRLLAELDSEKEH